MWPNQRKKNKCYYSSSASSGSRIVRSSTSRRPPSRTSSNLHTRFVFFSAARADAASDIAYVAISACLFVWGSVWRPLLIWSSLFVADGGFEWSRPWRLQHVRLILGRSLRHIGVQLRLRDSQILADLLQLVWVRIRPAESLRFCVPQEHSIRRIFRGHLQFGCVKMSRVFWRLNKIIYKFLHVSYQADYLRIDKLHWVARRALRRLSNLNRCWCCHLCLTVLVYVYLRVMSR